MGSFQALEWAIRYPNSTDRLVLVAPAARSDAHFRSIVMGIETILTGEDRGWSATARLRVAAALFMPWLRSDAYLVRRGEAANRAEVEALAQSWVRDWNPVDLLYRYRASAGHDVGVPFRNDIRSALTRVRASTLVLDISSDRVVPAYLTAELLNGLSRVLSGTDEVYGTCWALWGNDVFGWNGLWIGLSLGTFGVCQTLSQALLPGPAVKLLGERGAILAASLAPAARYL
jgi:homoserine acetyltransferase